MKTDYLIVGAGFAGSVCARVLADAGKTVHLIDKRPHIGGNAYDERDAHGVLIHPYGPHIFHTNAKKVFEFLSRFTTWRFYEHRVLAKVGEQLLPIPINRTTINQLYGLSLTEDEVQGYLETVREPRDPIQTSEDVVLNSVGRDLCDKFFRGYTKKQWGLDLSQLSAGVAARIPTRSNDDDRYFGDTFQFMPADGYTAMFERLLDHPAITVRTGVDFQDVRGDFPGAHIIYTGPIDAFFDHCHGPLPYRSLRFDHEHLPTTAQVQPVGTVNYPNDHDYTRITEFKHLTGETHAGTSIVREYPQAEGDPYYPVPRPENEALYKRYAEMADKAEGVTFVGRLAQYRYYNMDQIVAASLKTAQDLLEPPQA
ncbi:UDP-galactopyranose mutase [Mitsuaria sp. TWR114]|jgi:UDP-galactopyranose mutase|uniref:UDP-galactopyranose mutase n=1 Tax=unclassified Roseateles TaxID=2626991 RepID=UPI0008DEFADB|nr:MULTISPECIES: UDP-galactopyranose mutase [unclassified Roseateles]TXD86038.1 UDP-galactopyranose mutase [Mitsuaria sp. TWR114]SFR99157.1 UDP-galactopyranose mutase [Mitsuaria sp. PDC51]